MNISIPNTNTVEPMRWLLGIANMTRFQITFLPLSTSVRKTRSCAFTISSGLFCHQDYGAGYPVHVYRVSLPKRAEGHVIPTENSLITIQRQMDTGASGFFLISNTWKACKKIQ